MKSWFRNGLLILTLIALITPALPGLAKDLPEERLVPPLGLLGTTSDYSPQRYNMMRMIVASWKEDLELTLKLFLGRNLFKRTAVKMFYESHGGHQIDLGSDIACFSTISGTFRWTLHS